MQLDVLRGLCGPEVEILTAASAGKMPEKWEEVLVLDLDDTQRPYLVAGPSGSLHRVLRALEEEFGVARSANRGRWLDWGDGRALFCRMCVLKQARRLAPAHARPGGDAGAPS